MQKRVPKKNTIPFISTVSEGDNLFWYTAYTHYYNIYLLEIFPQIVKLSQDNGFI